MDDQGEEADRVEINSERIQPYTNESIHTFVRNFIDLSRRCNLNQQYTEEILTFIKSIVPSPNISSIDVTQLFIELGIDEHIFKKRPVCPHCRVHVIRSNGPCAECETVDEAKPNSVYDIDVQITVFFSSLRRLSPLIEVYRNPLEASDSSLRSNTIPLSRL